MMDMKEDTIGNVLLFWVISKLKLIFPYSDEDYGHDDTMESRGSHQGSLAQHNNYHGNHDDFYKSDSSYFDAPDFDNFFTKVEGGVEDEITSSPNYYGSSRSQHDDWQREDERNHHHNNDNDPYQR